ncbi:MAG: serine protease [Alphaproteobacteria bacterium]|nr:serine protease [Alphaproteobacteria bacterium]
MSEILKQLNLSFADAVAAAGPSIVGVRSGRRIATGVAWGPGRVVTSTRALSRRGVRVLTADGEAHPATILGYDAGTELALLQVEGLDLPPLPHAEAPRVGELVLVLGRPGEGVEATLGMVSAVGGPWRTGGGGVVDAFLEVDGRLPGGFSGGPLLSTGGGLIGVNTRGLRPGGATLPAETVARVVERLATRGSPQRGYLGVGVQPVSLPEGPQPTGLIVTSVDPEGPAQAGGVLLGDVLLRLDGQGVGQLEDLWAWLGEAIGREVDLEVLRAGETVTLKVTPVARKRRCA